MFLRSAPLCPEWPLLPPPTPRPPCWLDCEPDCPPMFFVVIACSVCVIGGRGPVVRFSGMHTRHSPDRACNCPAQVWKQAPLPIQLLVFGSWVWCRSRSPPPVPTRE